MANVIHATLPGDDLYINGEPAIHYNHPMYVTPREERGKTTVYTKGGTEIPNFIIGYRHFEESLDTKLFEIHAEHVEHAIGIFRTAPNPGYDSVTDIVFVTPNLF
jgi:hypothetical protein